MDCSGISVYLAGFGTTRLTFPYLAASLAAFADQDPESQIFAPYQTLEAFN